VVACVAWSGAGPLHDTRGALKPRNALAGRRQPCDGAPGLEVSLGQLLEHVNVQRLLGDELLQPLVLALELLRRLASSAFIPP
jgi:hypothetical protein